eukprot:TRINITY_DN43816_c0_g1_i1.p1 TRINITY_DN43816_c0_g1~~TRINITY_DN43816_c0_g1_i1.p1  ORF type:complete len:167 (-),score=42.04 TRINITY_DN43816_c0_g1_i1:94-594(-)
MYGFFMLFFFFQAEDGIRDAQESRGLGDVYKRQVMESDKGGLLKNSFPGTFDDFVRRTDLKKLGEDGVDLLRSMLAFDPANRISATKALQHPFLCEYEVQYLVPSSIYNSSIVQSSSDTPCAPGLSRGGGTTGSQASMASSSGATASISNPTPNTKQLSELSLIYI